MKKIRFVNTKTKSIIYEAEILSDEYKIPEETNIVLVVGKRMLALLPISMEEIEQYGERIVVYDCIIQQTTHIN